MQFTITRCDKCDGLLFPKQLKVQDDLYKPGIEIRNWRCPLCNHRHVIMVLDKKSKRMMLENKKDNERIAGVNKRSSALKESNQLTQEKALMFVDKVEKIKKRIDQRTKLIDEHSKKLIAKYETSIS
ncbi:hypothetical protein M3E13_11530 [Oceanobacillus kimchii]|uniref:hypothetical protein n=1 Tax=Oceanobacillus kimchii TaxID=746691 RepID=UPI0021A8DDFB|nr:hypothetical protein [Oceanobacillus kimchii]MCT1577548.1 hypothetical protein [Oceanobacillus kimchii]MCT2136536.1 hypothetical protein [Oceanobacillus kimchii]